MKLPRGRSILESTRLEFINLDNLLTASKRERAHRISGYISILYPDFHELIFLSEGEPFNAARIRQNKREIVPISEVIEKARKSTNGTVSEYATDDVLLRLIISSITLEPLKTHIDLTRMQPKIFIDKLKNTKFNGFIWIRSGVEESFIHFENGEIPGCYVAGHVDKLTIDDVLPILSKPDTKIVIFDQLEKSISTQATPAQVEMFCKIFTSLLKNYVHPMGKSIVLRTALVSKTTAQKEYPFIEKFRIDSDLTVSGEVVVEPKLFAQGMARLFDLIYESFSTFLGKESEVIAKKILNDYRFALKSLKFFDYSKLKI